MSMGMILIVIAIGATLLFAAKSSANRKSRYQRCAYCREVLNPGDGRVPAKCRSCGRAHLKN